MPAPSGWPSPGCREGGELFPGLYGRMPSTSQMKLALADIADNPSDKKDADENILWAVIDTREFGFNHRLS